MTRSLERDGTNGRSVGLGVVALAVVVFGSGVVVTGAHARTAAGKGPIVAPVTARTSWHFTDVHPVPTTLMLFNPQATSVRVWCRTSGAGVVRLWHVDVGRQATRVVRLLSQNGYTTLSLVADLRFIPSRLGGTGFSFGVPGSGRRPRTLLPMPRRSWHFFALSSSRHVTLSIWNPNDVAVDATVTSAVHRGVLRVHIAANRRGTIDLTAGWNQDAGRALVLRASGDVIPRRTTTSSSGSASAYGIPGPPKHRLPSQIPTPAR